MGRMIDADKIIDILKEKRKKINLHDAWSGQEEEQMIGKKNAYNDAIEVLKNAGAGWISVEEWLPDDYEDVLVTEITADGERTNIGYYGHYNGMWETSNDDNAMVIAWMPLPEPYKAGEEND